MMTFWEIYENLLAIYLLIHPQWHLSFFHSFFRISCHLSRVPSMLPFHGFCPRPRTCCDHRRNSHNGNDIWRVRILDGHRLSPSVGGVQVKHKQMGSIGDIHRQDQVRCSGVPGGIGGSHSICHVAWR